MGKFYYNGKFTFELTQVAPSDSFVVDGQSKTIIFDDTRKSTNVVFDPITFTQAGEYTFEIREQDLQDPRVDYSEDVITMTVTVAANASGDELTATATYTGGGKDGNEIVNKLLTTEWTPDIRKEIIGNAAAKGGTFKFKMEQVSESPEIPSASQKAILTVKDGNSPEKVPFQPVTFEKPGTYTFRFTEVTENSVEGVFYDSGEIYAEVVVEREENTYTYKETYYYQPKEGNPEDGRNVFKNIQTELYVLKVDENNEGLPGAELALFEAEENGEFTSNTPLEEWISTGEKKKLAFAVQPGHYYVLTEQKAPAGYVKAQNILIYVSKDGQIKVNENGQLNAAVDANTVVMVDTPTKVEITKVDKEGNPLSGALLQIINRKGEIVQQWTSGGTPKVIIGELSTDESYRLHEEQAPEGYLTAPDVPIILENGTASVEMVDEKKPVCFCR